MSGADAYFGEGEPMPVPRRRRSDISHSSSGRRHKQPDRPELAEGGFLPFLAPVAAALAPKVIGWAADKIMGRGAARPRNARLYGHELGFQGMGLPDEAQDAHWAEGGAKGLPKPKKYMRDEIGDIQYMRPYGSHPTPQSPLDELRPYTDVVLKSKSRKEKPYDVVLNYPRGDYLMGSTILPKGSAFTGGKKPKRKPSARNEMVRQVMREQGMSLGQASKFVKENGLA